MLYFDDVKVPWDRVFVNQDIAMCQRQFHATPAHVYQNYQSQIRLMVKLRFLVGIAARIAETNGIVNFPQVRETLGALAAQSTMVDALVHAMEVKGEQHGAYFVPDAHTALFGAGADAATLSEVISPPRTGRAAHDHAAVLRPRISPIRSCAIYPKDAAIAGRLVRRAG